MRRAAALAFVLLALIPASAAGQEIGAAAAGLKVSPLHVDASLRSALNAQERDTLTPRLSAQSPPVLVALVPLVSGDAVDGDARQLLVVLRSRTGRDDAVYATVNDGVFTALAPDPEDERIRAAASVTNLTDHDYSERVATTLTRFLDALDDPDVLKRAEEASQALSDDVRPSPTAAGGGSDGGSSGAVIPALIAIVVIVLGALLLLFRRRRGARLAPVGPLVLPDYVFEAARGSRRRELRKTVEGELVQLAERMDSAPVPKDERAQGHFQRALDARDAAGRLLADDSATDADLVGALVLEDLAQRALGAARAAEHGQAPPRASPLCALNPTHGRSAATGRWGTSPPLPVCDDCRRDLRAKRAPDVLDDGGRPYLERDTVWAHTAFGALVSDLPAEIVRERFEP